MGVTEKWGEKQVGKGKESEKNEMGVRGCRHSGKLKSPDSSEIRNHLRDAHQYPEQGKREA